MVASGEHLHLGTPLSYIFGSPLEALEPAEARTTEEILHLH